MLISFQFKVTIPTIVARNYTHIYILNIQPDFHSGNVLQAYMYTLRFTFTFIPYFLCWAFVILFDCTQMLKCINLLICQICTTSRIQFEAAHCLHYV